MTQWFICLFYFRFTPNTYFFFSIHTSLSFFHSPFVEAGKRVRKGENRIELVGMTMKMNISIEISHHYHFWHARTFFQLKLEWILIATQELRLYILCVLASKLSCWTIIRVCVCVCESSLNTPKVKNRIHSAHCLAHFMSWFFSFPVWLKCLMH